MKAKYNLHKKHITILTLAVLLILEPYNYSEKTLGSYYNSYNINRDINVNAYIDSEQNIKGGELKEGELIVEDVEILEEGVDKLNTKFNVE